MLPAPATYILKVEFVSSVVQIIHRSAEVSGIERVVCPVDAYIVPRTVVIVDVDVSVSHFPTERAIGKFTIVIDIVIGLVAVAAGNIAVTVVASTVETPYSIVFAILECITPMVNVISLQVTLPV